MKDKKSLKIGMHVDVVQKNRNNMQSWSDADFAADKGDRKSVTCGVVTLRRYDMQWITKCRWAYRCRL